MIMLIKATGPARWDREVAQLEIARALNSAEDNLLCGTVQCVLPNLKVAP
jgi:hypothetical protein